MRRQRRGWGGECAPRHVPKTPSAQRQDPHFEQIYVILGRNRHLSPRLLNHEGEERVKRYFYFPVLKSLIISAPLA